MKTIQNLTGKILHILDVIDGTKINDEMIQNILAIYFTPELKTEMKKLLNKYNNIFDPERKNIQGLKPGTVILGPYSSGKSHFALFLAFLFGLEISFSNPNLREEIPNIRERCWEILEKYENFGEHLIKEYGRLREEKYLVSFISLTNYREEKNFLSIIVDSINKNLKAWNINRRIGIEITQKNKEVILGHMKLYSPENYEEYSHQKNKDEQLIILKEYANLLDLRLKLKTYDEIAEELNQIAQEYNFKGYILFFDEFFRYYDPLEKNEKLNIGTVLQSFAYEIQNSVKLSILPMSQAPIFDKDEYLQQVERRFTKVNISYKNATSIIHKRLIPEVDLIEVENFYLTQFNHTQKRVDLETFKDYYPFHKKTIIDLEAMVGYYANDTKGIINFLWKSLNSCKEKTADKLITADTLYDYFIEEIVSPDIKGWDLKEKYEETNKLYISTLNDEDKELTQKILKILLFCTNRSRVWSLKDFDLHFYDISKSKIKNLLLNLVGYIEDQTNFISSDAMKNIFYYNPGSVGDINKYIKIIERALDERTLVKLYWNDSIDIKFGQEKISRKKFEWKKVLCKTYLLYPVRENLRATVRDALKLLTDILEKEDISFYDYDINDLVDGVFVIDKYQSLNEGIIEGIISEEIEKVKNRSHYLARSIFYLKPNNFIKEDIKRIKNYYARQISLYIFEHLSNSRNYKWEDLKNFKGISRFIKILDETLIITNLKQFKSENSDSISRYIDLLKLSIEADNPDNISQTLNNLNKMNIFNFKLKNAKIYLSNKWINYSNSDNNNIFEDIIKDNMGELIPFKYPKLDNIIVTGTKKLFGTTLTKNLNLLMNSVFINKEIFPITDVKTKQLLDTTFKKLELINNLNNNNYQFNTTLSLQKSSNLKLIQTIIKQNNNKVEISEVLIKYLLPPYGFPKIITFLMLLSLVYMQKYTFEYNKAEISSYEDIKSFISKKKKNSEKINKDGINSLIRRGYVVKGDIIEIKKFSQIKKIIKLLYNLRREQNGYCSILEVDNEDIKTFEESTLTVNTPSPFDQHFLIKLIKKIKMSSTFNEFHLTIIDFYDKLKDFLKSVGEEQDSDFFKINSLSLLSFSQEVIDLIDAIQNIQGTGKEFLQSFLNIFEERFDIRFFPKKIKHLHNCYCSLSNKENNVIQGIFKGFGFILKTLEISSQNWLNEIYLDIIKETKEILYSSDRFLNILTTGSEESNLIKSLNEYHDKYINTYNNFHKQFWKLLSELKEDFILKNEVFIEISNHLSKLKIGNLINNLVSLKKQYYKCEKNVSLKSDEIEEHLICNNCKIALNNKFNISLIPGFNYSLDIKKIDFTSNTINFNDILKNLMEGLFSFIVNQIIEALKNFEYNESTNDSMGKVIIENLSFKLKANDIREEFNGYVKKLDEFNYPKAKEIFLHQKSIENREYIISLLEFFYRISIIFKNSKNFETQIKQIKALNKILEKKGFIKFLNSIIEVNLSDLDKIKIKYEIFQLKDLISKSLKPEILKFAKKELDSYIDGLFKLHGNKIIIPPEKFKYIDEIYEDFESCNLNFPLIILKSDNYYENLEFMTPNDDYVYSSYDQISFRNPNFKDILDSFLKRLFSHFFYFGKRKNARKFFIDNKLRYMDFYIKNGNIWTKKGYFRILYGAIEEFKL